MAWVLLIIAGLLEMVWAVSLKYADGLRRPIPTLILVVAVAGSMVLLGLAVRTLPIGTAYAVWVGIGALGAAIMGAVLFQEPVSPARALFLLMLVISIVGLKFTSGDKQNSPNPTRQGGRVDPALPLDPN